MPGLMRLFKLGTWKLLALTAGWELGSLYSSPCPAISSVLIPWVSFSSISQDRGVESAPDYFKGFQKHILQGFLRPELLGESGLSGAWGLALGLHY